MKETKLFSRVWAIVAAGVVLGVGWISLAQTPPSRAVVFSEVVKLSQAHQSDDVILGYLKNSGASYALTADEIIYLNNQGVSQKVIAALQSASAAPAAPAIPNAPIVPPPATIPPPPGAPAIGTADANFNSFHDQLAPDGTWVDVEGYGPCWRPSVLVSNPDWRPYYDAGHWVYSDDGWFWQSDYRWGDIVFHYGRWTLSPHFGWVWVPAYNWGPSWVAWRQSEGYLGWAPLPPEARFEVGVGLSFHGRVGVDLDFGLGVGLFTFVGYDHFWEHDFRRFVVPHDRVSVIFHGSHLANDYRIVNGRFFNEGFGHEHVAAWTHHEVRVEHVVARDRAIERGRDRSVPGRDEHGHFDGRDGRDSGRGSRDGHDRP